jgi:pimeloyl-ACP methyl ester carboxylesterase
MSNIVRQEHWVQKGSAKLYVYRKHLEGNARGTAPMLFLIHGSSLSAVPSYDLHIPGYADYSVMDHYARMGFDVWTMDHEGYGRSSRDTDSNSDIACAVEDLRVTIPLLLKESGRGTFTVFGQSGGALRAAAVAQAFPDKVDRLILDGFVWTGKGSPTLAKRAERLAEWRASPRRKIDRDFFLTIFNRDHAAFGDPLVAAAWADYELALGDTFPTGTYLDMSANLPLIDPAKVKCPTLILRGEYDGIASDDDLIEFFRLLPNKDKQFVLLSGQAHVGPQAVNRHRFLHAMTAFLKLPERRDSLAKDR